MNIVFGRNKQWSVVLWHALSRACLSLAYLSLVACGYWHKPEDTQEAKHIAAQQKEDEATTPKIDLHQAAELNLQLAMEYLQKGHISRAKAKLNHAEKLDKNMPALHYSKGYFFERIGEYEAADKAYRKAIGLNPKGGAEHNNYGAFLCRRGDYAAAIQQFLTAVKDPEYTTTAEAYENAGLCAKQGGDIEQAVQFFAKALQHDAQRAEALLALSEINLGQGQFAKAHDYWLQYQNYFDPSARSLWLGIQIAELQHKHDKAVSLGLLLKERFSYSFEYKQYSNQHKEASNG